jgi:Flp pilus assembly protein TadG
LREKREAMRCGFFSNPKRFVRKEHGGVAVELAIILPIFVVLVFGIIDFGHSGYRLHLMSDASRAGTRFGSGFTTDISGTRLLPKNLGPAISSYIANSAGENGASRGWGLRSFLPTDANPSVTVSGAAFTEANSTNLAGEDVTVTVNATKTWFVVGSLVPIFSSGTNLTLTTTMYVNNQGVTRGEL